MKNGWQTKRLAEVATLQRGFDLPTQDRVAGEFPLVSSSGISDTHHKCAVRGPGVVTGRSGSIGNVFFIEEDFWPLNTVLYVKEFHGNDPRFVFHLLKKFDLQRFASGAGVPTLNRNFVHDELVERPYAARTAADRRYPRRSV
jgi:type I restriction enzyme, S subunit